MRYSQDTSATPALTLESPAQPAPVLNLYPPGPTTSLFNPAVAYSPDPSGPSFYSTSAHHPLISNGNLRRLGSSTSSTGMAHAPRSTALPLPGQSTTRDIYSPSTPSYSRRTTDHTPRSPSSFAGQFSRRNPLSPTPSYSHNHSLGITTSNIRMDSPYNKALQSPPMQSLVPLGSLHYVDGTPNGTSIKPDIHANIDKGFFQADGEWTCYRRNYFSCVCSYTMSPPSPSWSNNTPVQFVQSSSNTSFHVHGFAMSISAVVADNDGQTIDLVQHTPKRDKGPTAAPEKVRLAPRPSHPLAMFPTADPSLRAPGFESGGFGSSPTATEHTFERIQFKQATANNGKRRAAQQYYHLVVELWADVGSQGGSQNADQWVRVCYKKSAKMIVRGRSPGHYQSERRGSTSSGPGGSAGSLGYGNTQVMGSDFASPGSGILSSSYSNTYDPRSGSHYSSSSRHAQDVHMDTLMTGDPKPMSDSKDSYHYYPSTIYEGSQDPRQPVEMYPAHTPHSSQQQQHQHQHQQQQQHQAAHHHQQPQQHHRADHDTDSSKVKQEYDGSLPSLFYPNTSFMGRAGNCGRYDSKPTSAGFYPTMTPPSGLNMMT